MTMIETECDRSGPDLDRRWKLILAVDAAFAPRKVLYPACGFDVSPSLVFSDVTYVDENPDVAGFFDDIEGVLGLVAECRTAPQDAVFRFVRPSGARPAFPNAGFDMVISFDARPVVESFAGWLKTGGAFLTHPASQDATTLANSADFALAAVVMSEHGSFRVRMVGPSEVCPQAKLPDDPAGARAHKPQVPLSQAASLVFTRIG